MRSIGIDFQGSRTFSHSAFGAITNSSIGETPEDHAFPHLAQAHAPFNSAEFGRNAEMMPFLPVSDRVACGTSNVAGLEAFVSKFYKRKQLFQIAEVKPL
jgi:hypothetical protein